jgi:hypothetical protein
MSKKKKIKGEKKICFTVTLPLKTEMWQEHLIDKKFKVFQQIYNYLVAHVYKKRYLKMVETEEYKNVKALYKQAKDEKDSKKLTESKKLYKKLYEKWEVCISEKNKNTFYNRPIAGLRNKTPFYERFMTASNLGVIQERIIKAMDKLLYHDGKKITFLKYTDDFTYTNPYADEGDLLVNGNKEDGYKLCLSIGKHKNKKEILIPIMIKTKYDEECLTSYKQCNISLQRKYIGQKRRYFMQMVLEGCPPKKERKDKVSVSLGVGPVGIDLGTQTAAYSSNTEVGVVELADRVNIEEKKIRRIQRYIGRSKEKLNPNKFNENRTYKKGNRDKWVISKRCKKAQLQLKNMQRKQAKIREICHYELVNKLLPLGDIFLMEDMNFKGLQKRAKKTEVNEKTGKIKKKKRYGKSLAKKAPAKFLTILQNKLHYLKGFCQKVNQKELKPSQFNHLNGQYNKKKLSQRWNELIINGEVKMVQRDLYSAYLIQNAMTTIDEKKKEVWKYNYKACEEKFPEFIKLHDIEMERLRKESEENPVISSIGFRNGKVIKDKVKQPVIKDMFSMANIIQSTPDNVKNTGVRQKRKKKLNVENLILF